MTYKDWKMCYWDTTKRQPRRYVGISIQNKIICKEDDLDIFTKEARDRAKFFEYNIILTDELIHILNHFINYIWSILEIALTTIFSCLLVLNLNIFTKYAEIVQHYIYIFGFDRLTCQMIRWAEGIMNGIQVFQWIYNIYCHGWG